MIVIATEKCFLKCDQVERVLISYNVNHAKASEDRWYEIQVGFYNIDKSGDRDYNLFDFNTNDEDEAKKLYKEIVKQIREQAPDEKYMAQLIDTMLDEVKEKI